MPVMRWRVVCALREVMLSFWPIRWLSRVDLPTLGRPTMAMTPVRNAGSAMEHLIGVPGGVLLGAAAAMSLAQGADVQRLDAAFHLELLLVSIPVGGHHDIGRQGDLAALQILLQQGLGILAQGPRVQAGEERRVQLLYHLRRPAETAIQIDRAQHRLQRIGQDRGAAEAAALQLAFPQNQMIPQPEGERNPGKRGLLDQMRAQPAKIPLGQARIKLVEAAGDDAVEHAVPEKFQTLVMRGPEAAVRQGLAQQLDRGEFVTELAA